MNWPPITARFASAAQQDSSELNPTAWGDDHVGKPVPEFITGDECLFCHRQDIGSGWQNNTHNLNMRLVAEGSPELDALRASESFSHFADDAEFVMGGRQRVRYLKRGKGYGTLELLSVAWLPASSSKPGRFHAGEAPGWQARKFANSCAGCHATGVDPQTRSFSALSLDCFTCHGDVSLEHTKDSARMHLAKRRKDPARVVNSICAQCHVRTGKSRSTGLPFPNNFVAGDNLFRDFKVDFSEERLAALNPADRHVLQSVRDVVRGGESAQTCLSCHEVHRQSTRKHHRLRQAEICLCCHQATGPKSELKAFEVHSAVCDY